jgi:hypothetical protein
MKNPIEKHNLFVTPSGLDALVEIVEGMDNVAQAYQVMMFTMNHCHRLVQVAIDEDEARDEELSVMRDAVAPRKNQQQLELF